MKKLFIIIPLMLAVAIIWALQQPKVVRHVQRVVQPIVQENYSYKSLAEIPVPAGYTRLAVDSGTFGAYLRSLKFTDENTIYLYDGSKRYLQSNHVAVLDIDVGKQDLQQCADACMRLWAEHLFAQKKYTDIHFNFLNDGKPRYYKDYAGGDYSYAKFRKYLNYIFSYANTKSLYNELKTVSVADVELGDLFIATGNPLGHAVIVVDVAKNAQGERIFLLAQSFMPAQSIHVLRNHNGGELGNWYQLKDGEDLSTPECYFTGNFKLKRFGTGL